jgi:hypothetical protein
MIEFTVIREFIDGCGWHTGGWSHDTNLPPNKDKSMMIVRRFEPKIEKLILSVFTDGRIEINVIDTIPTVAEGFDVIFSSHLSDPECLEKLKGFFDDF